MSSNELLALLDGLMYRENSWYRCSVVEFLEELEEEQENAIVADVRSLIFAQLHGQKIEVVSDVDGGQSC